jgi:hypothetical protein
MYAVMKHRCSSAIASSVVVMVIVLGCGGDESGLARRYKVSGKVKYKGEPVAKGTIAFNPTNPPPPVGRPASSDIENGSYTLTTAIAGDGALPGEYKVFITSSNIDISKAVQQGGGLLHHGEPEHRAAVKAAKSLVPVKYSGEQSPLQATVKAERNTFDFDLTD